MKFLFKHKVEILILLALLVGYLILRLPNLTLQPIFADEAIYIRWAQVMRAEPTLRFVSLSDGKTPLFMWTMIPLLKFIHDPLFAGRFLSVISGMFTMLGVYFLSRKVFSKRAAYWAALLYMLTPYTVFFDRMALVDSMLASFTVWAVYFTVWLLKSLRLDLAMILGYLLGGAILTKTPGLLNLLVIPLSIVGFKREKGSKLVKLMIFLGVAIAIALVMYNSLRLGPEFQKLSARNGDYIFSPQELLGRPLDPFIPHFHDIADWFPKLLTWPILFTSIIGILYLFFPIHRLGIVVLLFALIPMFLNMAFLKTFTARYLLTSIPLFLTLGGFGVTKLLPRLAYIQRFPVVLMLLVLLPIPLYFDYLLLTAPQNAPLPKEERKGYFEDWTAGYGFRSIADFLLEQSKNQKVVLGTEGFFGTLPDGLQIYLDKAPVAIVPSQGTISAQLKKSAKDQLTYFVGNKKRLSVRSEDAILIKEYPKAKPSDGSPEDSIVFYQVLP